ncbi:MAG: hypothetical protein A2Z99_10395 [Treponema sp. GWB1_62_6]|nr:MAG: hypothetical protein A2Y36_10610 [Treponema sp. GWA1_62_8]OHE64927.1 MAG: hypothetical protein A2Z99_10395 [Treponema sp. GWB1_62_6]OHE67003.1 MAG: hypothetical protein A2001_08140 [Treponema sp. GWC1_61_84]OHE70915.1 MAG: hypothetical protein A2413_13335 [Treponema sp. RIFOXYC1_FULL_61_9]HCM27374.1 hypothetical protein [Treponema sp.]
MSFPRGAWTFFRLSRLAVRSLSVLLIFLPLSCATVPETAGSARLRREPFAGIENGAAVYLMLDVPECRPLLEEVAKLPELKELMKNPAKSIGKALDRTEAVAIAAFPAGASRRFALIATGDYPSPWTALSLTMSREWKRARDSEGRRYWRSDKGYSVALGNDPRSDLAFVSDGPPFPGSGSPVLPMAVERRLLASAAYGWMPVNESTFSGLPLSGLRLPVKELSFAMERADGLYALSCIVSAASAREIKALSSLVNLARIIGARDSSIPAMEIFGMLTENPPVIEGNDLVFRSRPRSPAELALLCARFSVYFTK